MATENEHEELTRAARLRAAFNSYLIHHRGEKFTQADLTNLHSELITEMQYSDSSVYAVLTSMANSGMIHKEKATDGSANLYYVNGKPAQIVEAAAAPKPVKPKVTPPAAIAIDLIKKTGKVRVTIQGISIEIGVVEE